jgi:hypothetical protein
MAGFYRGLERKWQGKSDLYHENICNLFGSWNYCYKFWRMNVKHKLYNLLIIKNEDLSENIEYQMNEIATWLGINYDSVLTVSSWHSAEEWIADSCYISRDDKVLPSKFYDPDQVKKRWQAVYSGQNDILMIETIFKDLMNSFGYKRITKNNIFTIFYGYVLFLMPHRGTNRFSFYKVDQEEKHRLLKRNNNIFTRLTPLFIITFFVYLKSILDNIYVLIRHLPKNDYWKPSRFE